MIHPGCRDLERCPESCSLLLLSCCANGTPGLVPTLLSADCRLTYNEGLALDEEDIAVSELALKTLGLQLFEVYRVCAR